MAGMKAQVKHQLRSKGIRTIATDTGKVLKLQQAKTSELIKVASKLAQGGFYEKLSQSIFC